MKRNTNKRNDSAYLPPVCSALHLSVCSSILTLSDGTTESLDPSEYEGEDDWVLSND